MRYVPLELLPELEAAIAAELRSGSWARRRDALAVALGLHGLRVGDPDEWPEDLRVRQFPERGE